MTIENLENLVGIKQLKSDPPDQHEFERLVNAAVDRLKLFWGQYIKSRVGFFKV